MDDDFKKLVSEYLELTNIITSALDAEDIDIVLSSIEKRQEIIDQINKIKLPNVFTDNEEILSQIKLIDTENFKRLINLKSKFEVISVQNKQKIKQVQSGKKAVSKYNTLSSSDEGHQINLRR